VVLTTSGSERASGWRVHSVTATRHTPKAVSAASRDRARHLVTATGTRRVNVARIDRSRTKHRKYSAEAIKTPTRVWVLSGCV